MSDRVTIADVGFSCATCFYAVATLQHAYTKPPSQWEELRCHRFPTMQRVSNGYSCGEWRTDQVPPPELGLAEMPAPFDGNDGGA